MNDKYFRLLIAGDPHICSKDAHLWQQAVADINDMAPHAVLVLGDLTGGPDTGSPESLATAVACLNQLDAPWKSIIGNHDLEWPGHATDADAVANFLHVNQRPTPWFRWDLPHLSILGLSNTIHRDGVVTQEIVLVDEQLTWLDEQLATMGDRPVILAVHAPPVGSGVVQLAELHAHVGNALVNQNHNPSSVMKRIWESPNILMSFSGHNHLGQHYRDALSVRIGVHFAHTGVIGSHTRDGFRHSRVLDLYEDHFDLLTFDHSLGRVDNALTYRSQHPLGDWLTYRRNHHLSRMVPADPKTMRQGPGDGPIALGEVRFAVLSDAHLFGPPLPIQRRVLEWANTQWLSHSAKHLLLNGDLSHHACDKQIKTFLNQLPGGPVKHLIPGNNEGLPLPAGLETNGQLKLYPQTVQRLADWPGHAWAMAITNYDDLPGAIGQLAAQLPETGQVLVVAHMAPKEPDAAMLAPLNKPGLHVDWICGHEHVSARRQMHNVTVHVVAGLDPVKAVGTLPEILLGVWDGLSLRIERRSASQKTLKPPKPTSHVVGIAHMGTAVELLTDAIEHDAPAVQFRDLIINDEQLFKQLLTTFKQRFATGMLSIHLPVPSAGEDGPGFSNVTPCVEWAVKYGMSDWTIHMPSVPASMLYTESGSFQNTPWAQACLARYVDLARQAVTAGAQLSLENVNNRKPAVGNDTLLSSWPWHVTKMIDHIREALLAAEFTHAQAQRVGMIFDSGHAFTDALVSKTHGLGDWIQQTAAYIQLAHIHQSIRVDGEYKRHKAIATATGGRTNHAGLLSLLQEHLPKPIVLLAEVRDRQAAILSVKTMKSILTENQNC